MHNREAAVDSDIHFQQVHVVNQPSTVLYIENRGTYLVYI